MKNKTKTTLNLDSDILKIIKLIAINKETSQTKLINDYLKEAIEKEPQKYKTNIKILVKRDPDQNIDDLIGSIKTPKPFNAVKEIEKIRRGEY